MRKQDIKWAQYLRPTQLTYKSGDQYSTSEVIAWAFDHDDTYLVMTINGAVLRNFSFITQVIS